MNLLKDLAEQFIHSPDLGVCEECTEYSTNLTYVMADKADINNGVEANICPPCMQKVKERVKEALPKFRERRQLFKSGYRVAQKRLEEIQKSLIKQVEEPEEGEASGFAGFPGRLAYTRPEIRKPTPEEKEEIEKLELQYKIGSRTQLFDY